MEGAKYVSDDQLVQKMKGWAQCLDPGYGEKYFPAEILEVIGTEEVQADQGEGKDEGEGNQEKVSQGCATKRRGRFALTSDIICMSWGGLGQLCNLQEVVLHGGQKEILNTRTRGEFTSTVSKTVEKLEKLPDKRAVVLHLPAVLTLDPEEEEMKEYFTKKFRSYHFWSQETGSYEPWSLWTGSY